VNSFAMTISASEKMFASESEDISLKDSVICEFLVEELIKYVSKSIKP
jgi:hypothetical protein